MTIYSLRYIVIDEKTVWSHDVNIDKSDKFASHTKSKITLENKYGNCKFED